MNLNNLDSINIVILAEGFANKALLFASYAFIILFIFNILKVDRFNPVVKGLIAVYKPISKITFFSNQLYGTFIISVLLNYINLNLLILNESSGLFNAEVALMMTINSIFKIIFYTIIGSVILSWVSPENSHPLFRLAEEISSKALEPIRRFIPSAGGLDFSPIFAFILIQQIGILLNSFLRFLS